MKKARIELSSKPFGMYCVRMCLTDGMSSGLSGEIQSMVLSKGYRRFPEAEAAVLRYMDQIYKMQGASVSVSESQEPVNTA